MNKLNNNKAVLFDLDGTLVDSWPDIEYALTCAIKKFSPEMTTNHLTSIKYLTSTESEDYIRMALKMSPYEVISSEIKDYVKEVYSKEMGNHDELYEGVKEIINFLIKNNLFWGIVTNRPQYLAKLSLAKFDILNNAKCLVGSDDVLKPKPEPDSLYLAAKILGVPVENCFFIGDLDTDIIAGKAAGMKTIAIKHGYGLHNYGTGSVSADFIVNDLIELNKLFGQLMLVGTEKL